MTAVPGSTRLPSTTARDAEKVAEQELNGAVIRRLIDALAAATGCTRKDARARIRGWIGEARDVSEIDAYLAATYRIDPVGVTAVRRVFREPVSAHA